MIVTPMPRMAGLLREIYRPLLILFVWDVAVTIAYYRLPFHAPSLPLTLFGTGLALFLGFRVNSAYQRWWEGRVLWGALINASRSLARFAVNILPDEALDLKRSIVLRQIAYANALRCQLRGHAVDGEVLRMLSDGEAEPALAATNVANALLTGMGRRIDDARRQGWIDTIQLATFERALVTITDAQGGMERLKNTPLPNQYRFLPDFFARLFCILLPIGLVETLGVATPFGSTVTGLMFLSVLKIGDDLVDPFANTAHDVPLTAMCRTIEIDLLEAIGDAAPAKLAPVKGVLW